MSQRSNRLFGLACVAALAAAGISGLRHARESDTPRASRDARVRRTASTHRLAASRSTTTRRSTTAREDGVFDPEAIPTFARMARSSHNPAYAIALEAGTARASHPFLALHTAFDARGVSLDAQNGRARFDFEGITRDGIDSITAAPSEPIVQGNRVTYDRGAGVSEHWLHGEPGLEQGFTLQARPDGEGDQLELVVKVEGDVSLVADAARVLLNDAQGETAFVVSSLVAWDADGRALESGFEVRGDSIAMRVRDVDARYPIVIDPFVVPSSTLSAAAGAAGDMYGYAVEITGDWAFIGAPTSDLGSNSDAGAVYVYKRSGNSYALHQTLHARTPTAGDQFGFAIALTPRYAIVGSPVGDPGSADVFELVGTTWTPRQTLRAPALPAAQMFGFKIAISGTTVAVSAPPTTVNGIELAGTVYVFEGADGTFDHVQTIATPNPTRFGYFGANLTLEGPLLVIGAPYESDTVPTEGLAYIYRRSGSTFALETFITSPTPAERSSFGTSIALSGETLFASVFDDGSGRGAVHAITRTDGVWASSRRFVAPSTTPLNSFGNALSVSGSRMLVGGTITTSPDSWRGTMFVFDLAGTDELPEEMLYVANGADMDHYGVDGAIAGTRVLVGAPFRDVGGRLDQGVAYVTHITGTGWADGATITRALGEAATFGETIGLSGNHAVVGAPTRKVNAVPAGALFSFERVNGQWRFGAEIPSPVPTAVTSYGRALAVSGNTMVVGASAFNRTGAVGAGRAYVYAHDGSVWRLLATLDTPTPVASGAFGAGVAIDGDTVMIGEPGCDIGGTNTGCVYVYTRSGSTFTQQARLNGSAPRNNAAFGRALAISAGRVAIGAAGRDATSDGTREGAVYVFARSAEGTWTEQALILPADATALELGKAVSLNGNVLAITAPGTPASNVTRVGAVFVYAWSANAWTRKATFFHPARVASNELGASVAQVGDQIVFGAPSTDSGALANAGAVYIARTAGTGYVLNTYLTSPNPAAQDRFGAAIGAGSGELWIGSPGRAVSGVASNGAVMTFVAR